MPSTSRKNGSFEPSLITRLHRFDHHDFMSGGSGKFVLLTSLVVGMLKLLSDTRLRRQHDVGIGQHASKFWAHRVQEWAQSVAFVYGLLSAERCHTRTKHGGNLDRWNTRNIPIRTYHGQVGSQAGTVHRFSLDDIRHHTPERFAEHR